MLAKSHSRLARTAFVALLVVGSAACTGDGTPTTTVVTAVRQPTAVVARRNIDNVLRIGMLLPSTGPAKVLAEPMVTAVKLAINDINEAGGFLGNSVVLYPRDEGADAVSAESAFAQLLDVDYVDVVVGPASSRVALGLIDGIARRKVPTCSPATTAIDLSNPADGGFFFRTIPSDRLSALALADTISSTGKRSVDIVYPDDDFGTAMAETIRSGLQRKGTTVLDLVPYDPHATTAEVDTVTDRVLASPRPEGIALVGAPNPGAQILGALRARGGPGIQMVVSSGLRRNDLLATIQGAKPDLLEGIRGISPSATSYGPAWTERFAQIPEVGSSAYAAYAYDCTVLLALAAAAAKTDDGTAIMANVLPTSLGGTTCGDFAGCLKLLNEGRNLDYFGASGPLDLADNGDPQNGIYDVFTFDNTGRDVSDGRVIGVTG
jgi:branched-chain amino acid transport system substrate-binding protein